MDHIRWLSKGGKKGTNRVLFPHFGQNFFNRLQRGPLQICLSAVHSKIVISAAAPSTIKQFKVLFMAKTGYQYKIFSFSNY